ncbi:MAG TPA: long-chain fatty acid--CoA ligase [Pleomorphomonadaceae bacterium]|nr:long-chain fatty acid--CoA ligase [Pleomorphomonadaceae bacterium]
MTTAAPAAPVAPVTAGRRMWNEVEPLLMSDDQKARNVVELIHRSVERIPDKEALRWKLPKDGGWVSRTYAEFWDWVARVSLGLEGLGIADGDTICIMSRTRPEWLVADLAGLALGAVTCPIYPQTEPGQTAFIINNVGASLIFVENAQLANKIESVRAQCPTLRTIVTFDAAGKFPAGTLTLEDLATRQADAVQREAWEERWRAIPREHLMTVIHTSGTTANPKGAMLTHGGVLYNYEAAVQIVDFYETDLFLSWLPLSHIFERLTGEIIPLAHGSTVAYAEPLIERLADNMVEVRPTVMAAVPRFYERVYGRVLASVEASPPMRRRIFHWGIGVGRKRYLNHLAGTGDGLGLKIQHAIADRLVYHKVKARTGGRVRYFVSGSAPLSREVGEFFYALGILILEGYGLSETSPLVSINRPGDFVFGTVGRPAPATEVRIDPETGEIQVRGPQIMRGYLNQPEETAKAIDPDGWFHTGDVGELDAIGRIKITDRLKNIIVLANGKNVSPGPMEAALSASKYIAQAVILGDRQPYTGALIAPNFDELGPWAEANGLGGMRPEQLVEERAVRQLIEGDVRALLDDFAVFERPRRIALLPRALSEENGELTPTLKTKLRVVEENWPTQIDRLFEDEGTPA